MERAMKWIETSVMPSLVAMAEQRHMRAVRNGVTAVLPIILVGSFALVFVALVQILSEMGLFPAEVAATYSRKLLEIFNMTMGVMGLAASFSIACQLASGYDLDEHAAGLLSVVAYLMSIPVTLGEDVTTYSIPSHFLGGESLIVAIVLAILAVEVQRFLVRRRLIIRMPVGVPPAITKPFEAIIPAAVIVIIVWVLRVLLGLNIHGLIAQAITPLLRGLDSLGGILLVSLLVSLLWSVGVHGAMVVGSIAIPLVLPLVAENAKAAATGQAILPHIATPDTMYFFVMIGGGGATLGLAFLMLRSKLAIMRRIGRLAILPGLFNINEPITFGLPIVMNPLMAIPFIAAPLVCTIVTYTAFALNLVSRPYSTMPSVLPMPLGAYLSTLDWRAIVLGTVNLLISTLVYYPFFRAYERRMLEEGS